MNQLAVPTLLVLSALLWPSRTSAGLPDSVRPAMPRRTGVGIRAALARRGRRRLEDEALVGLLAGLVPALRAGLSPVAALELVAASDSVAGEDAEGPACLLLEAAVVARDGGPLGPTWRDLALRSNCAGLELLGAAWSLTEDLGSPLADAVDTVVGVLRAREDRRRELVAATAGARATMNLLTALPVGGVGLALLVGLAPGELYGSTPALASLSLGVVLLLLGRWWVRHLVSAATAEPVLA